MRPRLRLWWNIVRWNVSNWVVSWLLRAALAADERVEDWREWRYRHEN